MKNVVPKIYESEINNVDFDVSGEMDRMICNVCVVLG